MVSALPFTQSTRKYAPTLPGDFWIAGLTFSVTSRTQRSRATWEPDQSVVLTSITTLLASHLLSKKDIMRDKGTGVMVPRGRSTQWFPRRPRLDPRGAPGAREHPQRTSGSCRSPSAEDR